MPRFLPLAAQMHLGVHLAAVQCRACPRSKPFQLNSAGLPSYDRRTCSRSRRPVVLDTSHSPAITLHGVVFCANIEVVPRPDGSQLSLWASKRVRAIPACSAAIHDSPYYSSHSSFCPRLKKHSRSWRAGVKPSLGATARIVNPAQAACPLSGRRPTPAAISRSSGRRKGCSQG